MTKTFEVSGIVRIKGNKETVGHWQQYSMMQIGDHIINNPRVPRSLDGFIEPGENVRLLIGKRFGRPFVILVQTDHEKAFYANGFKPSFWYLFIGIILLPVLFIGAAVIYAYFYHKAAYDYIENAVEMFPNKEKLPLSV